jgi:hypothetical protein
MKDVTLNNGKTMTDAEFIKERGFGDAPTDFVATKADLVSLANKLVDELLAADFFLRLQVSRRDIAERTYTEFRLCRVMDFLPELESEIQQKLRLGLEKNDVDAKKVLAGWDANATKESAEKNAGYIRNDEERAR